MLDRCGYRCQWRDDEGRCRATATDVDHIAPGDDHSLANLQGLCSHHHLIKTSREANESRSKRKALGRLPEEKQPGIIDGPPQPTQHRGF